MNRLVKGEWYDYSDHVKLKFSGIYRGRRDGKGEFHPEDLTFVASERIVNNQHSKADVGNMFKYRIQPVLDRLPPRAPLHLSLLNHKHLLK